MHRRCQSRWCRTLEGRWCRRFALLTNQQWSRTDSGMELTVVTLAVGKFARDLPETALRATSRRPTTRSAPAPLTCAVVRSREVLRGEVNHRRIADKPRCRPAGGARSWVKIGVVAR
jgi:hypothetical protein